MTLSTEMSACLEAFRVKTSDMTAWTVTHENGAAFNVGTFPRLAESSVGQLGC